MKTKIFKIKNIDDDESIFDEAKSILEKGGLVAFPTETVYGLGGNALNAESSKKIYSAKGRPSDNPLIVHIADFDEVLPLVKEVPKSAKLLMEKYWPGPMTLIFKASDIIPRETTGGLNTVAIRMPKNEVARKLIKKAGLPIAAPSANASGRPSPTKASHVIEDLDGRVDMIIDGGSSDIGLESTIIDVSGDEVVLLRPGYISIEEIREVVGDAKIDSGIVSKPREDERPKAPGMKYRHYAPNAKMTIISGSAEKVISKINELALASKTEGKKVGVICLHESAPKISADVIIEIGSRSDEEEIARNLFGAFRRMNEEKVDEIFAENFNGKKLDMAIKNRMQKASGYNILEV